MSELLWGSRSFLSTFPEWTPQHGCARTLVRRQTGIGQFLAIDDLTPQGTFSRFWGISFQMKSVSGLGSESRIATYENRWEVRRSLSRSCPLHLANAGAQLAIAVQ